MQKITVKQLADELNITTQAMHKKINQLPPGLKPKKVKGAYAIQPETADYIRENTASYHKDKQPDDNQADNQDTTIKTLQEQLKTKDEQIKELHRLLNQQQQLNLHASEQINQFQIEHKEQAAEKRRWWQIFK